MVSLMLSAVEQSVLSKQIWGDVGSSDFLFQVDCDCNSHTFDAVEDVFLTIALKKFGKSQTKYLNRGCYRKNPNFEIKMSDKTVWRFGKGDCGKICDLDNIQIKFNKHFSAITLNYCSQKRLRNY